VLRAEMPLRGCALLFALCCCGLLAATPARAQQIEPSPGTPPVTEPSPEASPAASPPASPVTALPAAPASALQAASTSPYPFTTWQGAGLFAAGAASAFLLHESGHVLTGALYGSAPHFSEVHFLSVIPFFAVDAGIECYPDGCFRRGEPFSGGRGGAYLIFSAGFHAQHLEDELILSLDPDLRQQDAPFRKGMLAFNTLTSVGYVLADLAGIEPTAGDIASIARISGRPRLLVDGLLLGIAGLDLARYAAPDLAWLVWVSRGAKLFTAGLVLSF
jgi:hypothetical protein